MPEVQDSLEKMADILSVMQHHDAITGTHQAHVDIQYNYDMDKAFNKGAELYAQEVGSILKDKYGVELNQIALCNTVFNTTQVDCKISNKEGFIVVHNPSSQVYDGLARISLPAKQF